jgi:hypothetical protein
MGGVSLIDDMISTLSDEQEIVLSVLFVFSGLLSIFGSSTIIYKVVKNQKKAKTYDRIMLGLSCSDIVASLAYVMTPFLLPEKTSQRIWASGNDVTCSFLGWLTQLGFAAIWYNGMLSYYYLATLKFAVSSEDFAARFEPYIHTLTTFFFLFSATAGVPFGLFSEYRLGLGCWIADFPKECVVTGGCLTEYIGWICGGFPLLFTFFSLAINNLVIFCHVKKTLRIGRSHTPAQEAHIRRVATQGFLYVATFFISYSPQLIIRILGGSFGYRSSKEADIFGLLVLNSFLLPLQGFFNMFVYTRPNFLRLKSAGASNWMAMRGSCLEPNIHRFTSIPSSHIAVASSQKMKHSRAINANSFSSGLESEQEANRRESLEPSGKFEVVSDEGSTADERDSSEYHQLPKIRNAATRRKQTSSILKMDGSITGSEVEKA